MKHVPSASPVSQGAHGCECVELVKTNVCVTGNLGHFPLRKQGDLERSFAPAFRCQEHPGYTGTQEVVMVGVGGALNPAHRGRLLSVRLLFGFFSLCLSSILIPPWEENSQGC